MSATREIAIEVPFTYCSKCTVMEPKLVDRQQSVVDGKLVTVNPGRWVCDHEKFCRIRDGGIKSAEVHHDT